MAKLEFDDEHLSELIAEAVKNLIANERAKLGKLSDTFLDEMSKMERELVQQIEASRDRFEKRAQAKIDEANASVEALDQAIAEKMKRLDDGGRSKTERGLIEQIEVSRDRFEKRAQIKIDEAGASLEAFDKAIAERKKRLDDLLSVKILAGFSAILLIVSIVALSYLADRINAVNEKVARYDAAAKSLDESRGQLQEELNSATNVYKQATPAGDPAGSMQNLTGLVAHIDGDTKRIDGEVKKLRTDTGPVVADWQARHKPVVEKHD
jgi:hypothetical protein